MAQRRSRVWHRVLRRYSSSESDIKDLVQTYKYVKAETNLRKQSKPDGKVVATAATPGTLGTGVTLGKANKVVSEAKKKRKGRSLSLWMRLRLLFAGMRDGLVRVRNSAEFHFLWKGMLAGSALLLVWLAYQWWKRMLRSRQRQLFKETEEEGEDVFDVCVVGAGPAGSVCAYYLAKAGLKVALIEKQRFPHDRVCGDIVAPPAHPILAEMGVLQELLSQGIGKWLTSAGGVSPGGVTYVAELTTCQDMAVQRIVLDHRLAAAAVRQGVHLVTMEVESMDQQAGMGAMGYWSVRCRRSPLGDTSQKEPVNAALQALHSDIDERTLKCRMVVAADGAMSRIATAQGLVDTPPNAVCLRSFAKPGTHNFYADFVIFHPSHLLPGFVVITREVEDYLSVCCFVMPGGATEQSDLFNTFTDLIENDPHIKACLGPDVELTPIQSAPMRLGCLARLYKDQFLVVGEAAGHVDPLAGQGIQYAMVGAKLAAKTIMEAFARGDVSGKSLWKYQQRINREFGWDMWIASALLGKVLHKFPIILDATAAVVKRNGEELIRIWRTTRSGSKSKFTFIRPDILFMLFVEFLYQWIHSKLKRVANKTRAHAQQRIAMLPRAPRPVPVHLPPLGEEDAAVDGRSPLHR